MSNSQLSTPMIADFSILANYSSTNNDSSSSNNSLLSCPLTVWGGRHDNAVPHKFLYEWADYTTDSCSVHVIPGDHFLEGPENSQENSRNSGLLSVLANLTSKIIL